MAPFVVTIGILLLCVAGAGTAATVERYRDRRRYDPRHGSYVGTVKMPVMQDDAVTETIPISRALFVRPFVPADDPAPVVVDPVHVGATETWSPLAWASDEVIGYHAIGDKQRQRDRDHADALIDDDFVRGFRAVESHLRFGLAANEELWATDETILRWISAGLAEPRTVADELHDLRVWVAEETATGEYPKLVRHAMAAR